ncbi:MAG: hypothetical protein K2J29_03970, partial [Muribaculaceae bacterium]|nr:hypothetical protein [Muribaculaceae bacterium]
MNKYLPLRPNHVRVVTLATLVLPVAWGMSVGQYRKSEIQAPPPPPESEYLPGTHIPDSIVLPAPVSPTLPRGLEDYAGREYAADLRDPSNIKTEAVYDPATGMFVIHTRLGDRDIVTPYMMTAADYNAMVTRREMFGYFHDKNSETFENKDK